jgi:hypothetical protein
MSRKTITIEGGLSLHQKEHLRGRRDVHHAEDFSDLHDSCATLLTIRRERRKRSFLWFVFIYSDVFSKAPSCFHHSGLR